MATSGKLHVTVVEARVKTDQNMFSSMKPYVQIEHRMERHQTKVSENGGKEPKFNETFMFDVKYIGDDFHMRLMNDGNLMADATIKVSGLCVNGGLDEWFVVQKDGKEEGHIHFSSKWEPAGAANQAMYNKPVQPTQGMIQNQMPMVQPQQPGMMQPGMMPQPGMMQPGMMQPGMIPMQPMQPGMMPPMQPMAPGMMPAPIVVQMNQNGITQEKCAQCNFQAVRHCSGKSFCGYHPCGKAFCIDHQREQKTGGKYPQTVQMCSECEPKFIAAKKKSQCCIMCIAIPMMILIIFSSIISDNGRGSNYSSYRYSSYSSYY